MDFILQIVVDFKKLFRLKILLHLTLVFWSLVAYNQTRIKAMTYNLMHFPGTLVYDEASGTYTDRTLVLKGILDSYQPDLLMVCELESATGADMILQTALATPDNRYNRANYAPNQSNPYDNLQQMVFYNEQKLSLVEQNIIYTDVRDINHYVFQLNTDEVIMLDVFVTHLKASTGYTNEIKRLEMVQEFTNYLESIPTDHFVLFTGDFNLYNSDEPAYQEILDVTNHIVMEDPINAPGDWSSHSEFTAIHTQSPLVSNGQFQAADGGWDGVTGGLDDRFDFLMMSQNFRTSPLLYYVPNTYKSYGNNGNCYNSYINNPDCSGTYSQELRNLLVNMSDHVPIVMEFETPETLDIQQLTYQDYMRFDSANVSSDFLRISISDSQLGSVYEIINQMGQTMQTAEFDTKITTVHIESLATGIYYIQTSNGIKPLKFFKI